MCAHMITSFLASVYHGARRRARKEAKMDNSERELLQRLDAELTELPEFQRLYLAAFAEGFLAAAQQRAQETQKAG